MIVLACGGREYGDLVRVYNELDTIHDMIPVRRLVHGDARGADRLARDWARARGVMEVAYPADWNTYGPAAGPIRNQNMLACEDVDVVVAFPGGRGTADMVRRALEAGVSVLKVK